MDNKLSSIIEYKLPKFVRDEHEMFVAFVQAFYEHAEEEGNWLHFLERFQRNLDIDKADDDFLENYLNEFSALFPKNLKIETPTLLRMMKEFYLAKGSESSFRFLFTIMYGVDIEIIYPREQLFIPSSGVYSSDIVAYITGANWYQLNTSNYLNSTLTGLSSGSNAIIDTITSTVIQGQQVLRLLISSYDNDFEPGEQVTLTIDDRSITEDMLGSLVDININDGGQGYVIGDTIDVVGAGIQAKAEISNVKQSGFTDVNVIDGGSGYEVGDRVKAVRLFNSSGYGFSGEVHEVDQNGSIQVVRVFASGYDYEQVTKGVITSVNGTGADLDLVGDEIGTITGITLIDGGFNYQSGTTLNIQSDTGSGANLTPIIGGVFIEPERYIEDRGMLSSSSKLLDSYYYQRYSYVIASSVSPHEWLSKIKRINHPAGTRLFGMYKLQSVSEMLIDVAPRTDITLSRTFEFSSEGDLALVFTSESFRTLNIQYNSAPALGSSLSDLDDMKFQPNFNWTIGHFADNTIGDVESDSPPEMIETTSSTITITSGTE